MGSPRDGGADETEAARIREQQPWIRRFRGLGVHGRRRGRGFGRRSGRPDRCTPERLGGRCSAKAHQGSAPRRPRWRSGPLERLTTWHASCGSRLPCPDSSRSAMPRSFSV